MTGQAGQFLGVDMPNVDHVNNANMFTPPDGSAPRMQMYLFTSISGSFASDPTPDVNGGDDASVVYHEYTHGLSSRLITYADGWSALDAFQSAAMGEGWSDWYAMDYLVAKGYAPNTAANGEVTLDRYVGNGKHTLRTEGLDCPLTPKNTACPGGSATGSAGGYTLGDMGRVCSCGPEVHADGEIWAQTLWDLRTAVGVSDSRFLVTEAMRLSPTNPSFLEMRDAILAGQPGRSPRRPHEPREPDLAGLRRARDGLLRDDQRAERHGAGRELRPAAGPERRRRIGRRHRDRLGQRPSAGRRPRRVRRARLLRDQRRRRPLLPRERPRDDLPDADGLEGGLPLGDGRRRHRGRGHRVAGRLPDPPRLGRLRRRRARVLVHGAGLQRATGAGRDRRSTTSSASAGRPRSGRRAR